ncbi:MAG: hypothetical protein AB7F43_09930 [Bacteriovoracia bacterium]
MAQKKTRIFCILVVVAVSGCARFRSEHVSATENPEPVSLGSSLQNQQPVLLDKQAGELNVANGAPAETSESTATVKTVPDRLSGNIILLKDISDFDEIGVQFDHSEIHLVGNVPRKKAKIETKAVALSADSAECKVVLIREGTRVVLREENSALKRKCTYKIDFSLDGSTPLKMDLVRSKVFIEGWSEPIDINLKNGDIDLVSVGQVDVTCVSCNLTGEALDGPVNFKLENGNVGLTKLVGPVSGQTIGDIVLQWKKISTSSEVQLRAPAGDVVLTFPYGVPVAPSVKAKTEVVSKLTPSDRGVPVNIVADSGQVKLFRSKR